MDRKSKCESKYSDSLWFSNLQLLGFSALSSPQFSSSMFDYPNPVAFQHVFYFLFGLLSGEDRTRMEFRDCWPILDRKQEAEFRRKVVTMLKEYQKDFPLDIPYTNPSLFQSPGGRKFMKFLHIFSNFVMKLLIDKPDQLLYKSATKNNILRRVCYKNLVKSTAEALEMSTKYQVESEKIIESSKVAMKEFEKKFFAIKNYVEVDDDLGDIKLEHSAMLENDEMRILKTYDEKCARVTIVKEKFKSHKAKHDDIWNDIVHVVDSTPKQRLNFDLIPSCLVSSESIQMSFSIMIAKLLSGVSAVLQFQPGCLPVKEMAHWSLILSSEMDVLAEVQAELSTLVMKMQDNVEEMLTTSSQIDWLNSELALPSSKSSGPALLPPTPSMLDVMKANPADAKPNILTRLQLLSPTPTPTLNPSAGGCMTPLSTGQVVIQSTLLRAEDEVKQSNDQVEGVSQQESRSSLSVFVFSPVQSSTRSPSDLGQYADPASFSSSGLCPSFSGLRDVTEASLDNTTTQSKIELYKSVLSAKSKEQEVSATDSRTSLLSVWEVHRQSLSPQSRPINLSSSSSSSTTSRQGQFSPMLASNTPDMTSRLNQLISSLTLCDTSLDLSLGRMSFGREEMLSPDRLSK